MFYNDFLRLALARGLLADAPRSGQSTPTDPPADHPEMVFHRATPARADPDED